MGRHFDFKSLDFGAYMDFSQKFEKNKDIHREKNMETQGSTLSKKLKLQPPLYIYIYVGDLAGILLSKSYNKLPCGS